MTITTAIITEEAQAAFNEDMKRSAGYSIQNLNQLRDGDYTIIANFSLYRAEAGWQEWMNEYTDAEEGEPSTEIESNLITEVQRKMWETFWEKAAKEICKAEDEYCGEFVKKSDVDWKNCKFKLNGEEYEYTDRGYNGEYYHGWNVKTKEDYAIRPVNIELDEDEWTELGYVVYPWTF